MTIVAYPPALLPLLRRIDALAAPRGVGCYAVGGTVRDALLARDICDLDIAVDGNAMSFARVLAAALGGHVVELDRDAGVARVVPVADATVRHIDIAALRGALVDDLRRRDLTINAMASPLLGGDVVDVTSGVADLAGGLVRMTARDVLLDDPLRMLRAVRIAGELTFDIEPETAAAVRVLAPRLREAAAERQRDELARILALPDAYRSLCALNELALLDVLLPELGTGRGVSQPVNHHSYDVFWHGLHAVGAMDWLIAEGATHNLARVYRRGFAPSLASLRAYLGEELGEGRPRAVSLKLAALMHDIAKPQRRTVDADGRIRFFGHADAGAAMAARIMRRLRFSTREVAFARTLVAEHLRPVQLAAVGDVPTRRAIYRFYRDAGDAAPAVLLLALADAAASRGPRMTAEDWSRHVAYMHSLLVRSERDAGIVDPPRLLTGRDIMSRFGVPESRRIGELLEELREAQAAGQVSTEAQALAFVAGRIEQTQNGDERGP
jgi:putative nucleotidyltransferase with HDIG domain